MRIEIKDDVIWFTQLKCDPTLYATLTNLGSEEPITLRVDGILGTWARMRHGRDGRPVMGIKPLGAMKTVWARMQERRGEPIDVSWPDRTDDAWLKYADMTFDEWYSAEDEEAFGDLRPL